MKILGLQKLTLLDYPGYVAAIVFLGGCNLRCPFCQNSSLVLAPEGLPEISREEFLRFLKKRAGILEGICVTGGEPTLHPELPNLLSDIRDAGYLVKLDTNGTDPDMLESLLRDNRLDYVAMDIKAGSAHYAKVCGLSGQRAADLLAKIKHSIELLKSCSIPYEFRTTAVKGLHDDSDFLEIRDMLCGCENYYIQNFRDCPEVLLADHPFAPFSVQELHHFLEIVQPKIPNAALRGI